MPEEARYYRTKDRNLVLTLLALGHKPVGCEQRNGITTFVFAKNDVARTLQAWFSNDPIPLSDARLYIIAGELFNSYIRGDSPEGII